MACALDDDSLKKVKGATVDLVDAGLEQASNGFQKGKKAVDATRRKLNGERTAKEQFNGYVDEVTDLQEYKKACRVFKEHGLSAKTSHKLWHNHCVQTATVLSAFFVTLMNIKRAPRNVLVPAFLVSGYKMVRDGLRK